MCSFLHCCRLEPSPPVLPPSRVFWRLHPVINKTHAVLVISVHLLIVVSVDKLIVFKWPVVDVVVPSVEAPNNLGHVRVQVHDHLRFRQGAFTCVEFFCVASLHSLRRCLAAQESIELDRTQAILENSQAEIGILVVPSSPPVRCSILNQQAGIDSSVGHERRHAVSALAERIVIHTGHWHVGESVDKIL